MTNSFCNSTDNATCNDTNHGDSLNSTAQVALCVYYAFVIIAGIICNTALIAVIAKTKELHTMSHLFIVNLAVSNLLTSIIYLPFDIDEMLHGGYFSHGKTLCAVYKLTFMLSLPVSMINLCLLTLETFLTIVFPYKKSRIVNRKSAASCLIIGYTYAIIFTTFPVLLNPSGSILILDGKACIVDASVTYIWMFVAMNLFVPLCIIITLNIWIYCIANGQTKKIRRSSFRRKERPPSTDSFVPLPVHNLSSNESSIASSLSSIKSSLCKVGSSLRRKENPLAKDSVVSLPSSSSSIKTSRSNVGAPRLSFTWQREGNKSFTCAVRGKTAFVVNTKAAKRIGLLVGECLFCWLIYDIIVLRNIIVNYSPVWTRIGNVINYSSLFLNPLVYGMYNPKIKAAILKTLRYYLHNLRVKRRATAILDRDSFVRFIVASAKLDLTNPAASHTRC